MHITIHNIKGIAITACSLFLPAICYASVSATAAPRQAVAPANVTVKGQIVDEDGEPVMGATVMVKGTSNGTSTDLDGAFSLSVPSGRKITLSVSYIGMKPAEYTVKPGENVTITLQPDANVLDEVIVSGFQTISRERSTGSAIVINKDKIGKVQAPNLSAKLEGITPGLSMYNNQMSIRGTSSFSIDSTPLLVIDGQPATGTTLNDINPDIIASVTVLKDAAATSLYGVRASNGVIVVTTKNGNDSRLDINASASFYLDPVPSLDYQKYASTSDIINFQSEFLTTNPDYIQSPSAYFSTLTGKNNAKYMNQVDMLYYRLSKNEISENDVTAGLNALRRNDYRREYRDHLLRNSLTQDYNLSISKGGDNYGFYAAARYRKLGLYNKHDSDDRLSLYLKNDLKITKWFNLTLGADISFNRAAYSQASYMGETDAMAYDALYNADGTLSYRYPYNQLLAEEVGSTPGLQHMGYNAIEESQNNMYKTDNLYMKYFIQAGFDITKDLDFEVKFQYEKRKLDGKEYDEADSYMMRSMVNEFASTGSNGNLVYNIPQGGRLYMYNASYDYYNLRAQANYKKTFAEKHDVTALLGGEIRQDHTESHSGERFGYDDQKLTYTQVDWKTLSTNGVVGQLYSTPRRKSENLSLSDIKHRYVSAYFNLGYIYDARYALNASVRVEQADLFGSDPKYRYRPLWSVGGSWNISNEEFMKDFSWINTLKLRATYGITGNVDQSSSPYLLASFGTSLYTSQQISMILTPPNSSLRWERTSTFNAGVDFRLFNRLSGSIDAYRKYSSDLLVNKRIDPSLGFNGMARANNGEMKNTGVELNLSYDWISTRDLVFTTSFSAAYNSNRIEKVDYEPTDALDMMREPGSNYRIGDTYNSLYAYKYAGLTDTGRPSVYDENGEISSVKSVRNVGAVVCVGQLTPKWNGALNLDLRWKGLNVFAKIVYYTGHSLRRDVPTLYDSAEKIASGAVHKDIADRWTPDNTDTRIPAIGLHDDTGESNYQWKYADVNTCSASFAKLRNVGVSYTFPKKLLTRTKFLKGATLRFQVDNLCRWTANKYDIDPEAFNANTGSRSSLTNSGATKPTYIFGVNINL